MNIEDANKKEIIMEIMNTSLFSIEEKLKIIDRIRKDSLSDKEISDILTLINHFENGITEIKNEYYGSMDRIYAQYLDKNIPQLRQGITKMNLEVKEVKMNEEEGNPDILLNQID